MDFSLTEQQEQFRGYVRKVLSQVSETHMARKISAGDESELEKVHHKLTELGVMGITVPEQYGGIELGSVDLIPVMEELGRAVAPDVYAETLAFAVPLLIKYGTDWQKEMYLQAIAEGSCLLSIAWLEPHGQYTFDTISTTALKTAQGYVLNGTKSLVRNTSHVTDFLLLAKDQNEELCLFLLPKEKVSFIEKQYSFDETQPFSKLVLSDVMIPEKYLLKAEEAESAVEKVCLSLLTSLNSMMIGGMDRLVDMSTEYAKIREQFGQPIGRFQAIKHRLADLKVTLETARALSHYAAWTVENESEDCAETVYSAKAFLADSYIKIAAESIQIHGGIGFTEELDCHLYVKRSRVYENYLGSQYDIREKAAAVMGW